MKLLFTKGPLLFFRTLIYVVLAIVLMNLNAHVHAIQKIRIRFAALAYPVQWVVDLPSRTLHWMETDFVAHESLLTENKSLRTKQLVLEAKLQRFQLLVQENKQLKQLLQSSEKLSNKVRLARILAVDLNPALQEVIINVGKQAGVYVGQPVLDAHGVMGQVIEVGSIASKVLLISDTRSAIPVQDARNGLRAIAAGAGKDKIELINVTKTNQVEVGDHFVCSGLAQRFPMGYPVGVVTSVQKLPGDRFTEIQLKPAAQLDRSSHVLLVWPGTYTYQKAVVQLMGVAS